MTSPCFQVEVVTKAPSNGGSAVEIHRYMAAGSCIGVEVWQPSGLLGKQLEAELTSLVCASHTGKPNIPYPRAFLESKPKSVVFSFHSKCSTCSVCGRIETLKQAMSSMMCWQETVHLEFRFSCLTMLVALFIS